MRKLQRCLIATVALPLGIGQAQDSTGFSHADSLRGSNGPGRAWWDVTFYDLHVRVDPADSTIRGQNAIVYRVLAPHDEMQIDLRAPLEVDSIVQRGRVLTYRRDGDALFVTIVAPQPVGQRDTISAHYHANH